MTTVLPKHPKRVLVCGGRNYHNRAYVFRVLDAVHEKHGISAMIQGVANGADYLGWQWADENDVGQCSYPADWKAHGRAAGVIRNQEMLVGSSPDVVIAFPGGIGTADMVKRAKAQGVLVWEPKKENW